MGHPDPMYGLDFMSMGHPRNAIVVGQRAATLTTKRV
jgi:hypothetical protein